MAPIGTVTTSFALDKSEYQGTEPVTGTVSIRFRPPIGLPSTQQSDLFGPLSLRVVLKGHLTIAVSENRTSHAHIFFNEKRSLLSKSTELLNGPYRAAPHDSQHFPFRIQFPYLTDAFKGQKDLLPPSFQAQYSAQPPRQLGKHHGSALIEYDVRVEAEMVGIDVAITNDTLPAKITYQLPAETPTTSKTEFTETVQLQSYGLLPEEKRPSLLERTRAKMKGAALPSVSFAVTCSSYPETLAPGAPVQFDVRVRHESKDTNINSIPEIAFSDCKVDLIARTQLYATNHRGADSARIDGSEIEASLPLTKVEPPGVFSKENDYTKRLTFDPLPNKIPCSFLIKKLGRSYKLRIELQFLISGEKVSLVKTVSVRVLPPPISWPTMPEPEAGPSRVNRIGSRSSETDELPKYHEIGRSAPPFQHL